MNPTEIIDRAMKSIESFGETSNQLDSNKMLSFADSYNSTRMLAMTLFPNLEHQFPQPVVVEKVADNTYAILASFEDINDRFSQLLELIRRV